MTYGRARLWLGIAGVGSLVTMASIALTGSLPQSFLQTTPGLGLQGLLQLAGVTGLCMLVLMPLDFLGGFWLPKRFNRSPAPFGAWLKNYSKAAILQAILFVFFGSMILLFSQNLGPAAGLAGIGLFIIACFVVRNRLILGRQLQTQASADKLLDVITLIQAWQIFVPQIVVVEHKDMGFTGGITDIGKNAKIVIPQAWLAFSTEHLATAVARRAMAISSGSYNRGLILAFVWNVAGFLLCALLPQAELTSVAGLVTIVCGFTLWSFVGLLTLPTLSRNASLRIDQELVRHGMPAELISNTALAVDRLQDDEPQRPRWVETIFHPVPSVSARNSQNTIGGIAAWNVARTALFFSWACLGILSRAVHCNVGRPELWAMLPTD
jgi:hypothetical protein